MKKSKILWLFLIPFFPIPCAQAETSLVKSVKGEGFRHRFELIPITFYGTFPYEMEFHFTYRNNCTGAPPRIGIGNDNISYYLEPNGTEIRDLPAITGYGPLRSLDINPNQTKKATTNEECDVVVVQNGSDIGPTTKKNLNDKFGSLAKFSGFLDSCQSTESLGRTVQKLIAQLDPNTLGDLLKTTYDNVKNLRDALTKSNETEKASAVDLALDEFESAICDSPVFREKYSDICGANSPSESPGSDALPTKIDSALTAILEVTGKLTTDMSQALSSLIVSAWEISSYASETTRSGYREKICLAAEKLSPVPDQCQKSPTSAE